MLCCGTEEDLQPHGERLLPALHSVCALQSPHRCSFETERSAETSHGPEVKERRSWQPAEWPTSLAEGLTSCEPFVASNVAQAERKFCWQAPVCRNFLFRQNKIVWQDWEPCQWSGHGLAPPGAKTENCCFEYCEGSGILNANLIIVKWFTTIYENLRWYCHVCIMLQWNRKLHFYNYK